MRRASRLSRAVRTVEFRLLDDRGHRFAGQLGAVPGGEHRSTGGLERRELSEAQAARHVVADRLHAAAHEIRFVPEAGSAGRPQEVSPPLPMQWRTGLRLQFVEVAPILTHAEVQRDQRNDEILVEQEPVRLLIDGILDLRTQAKQRLSQPRR
jgi:hypothetical protein